ncbi:uncharacterized protein LOC126686842 [Mercurialis annua]|uniref:uncharacterized protein LOC126686842 n=1 Tax=Mercurialis annua TaxID=3986 RepID=UPI00215E97D2|nr:uncharacterized protein LOC126686842 [Mercurialis annua]
MDPLLGFHDEIMEIGDGDHQNKDKSSSTQGYRLVPWLNWEEWEFIRDSLFSGSPDKVSAAINRISTWRSRGCLPVIIDVTSSIIEIQQKDPHFRKDLPSDALHSEQMLAMLYCMAILRLVNCVVEKTRKKNEISIAEAASAIGIPRTLIDVRHEGSHRDMPSLTLLRSAAAKALGWMSACYWEPQSKQIPTQRDGIAKIKEEIKSKLSELVSSLKVRESPHTDASPAKGKGLKKQTKKALKALVHLYGSFSSEVLSILLEFLLKALGSSNILESPDEVDQEVRTLLDDWKLVIVKLSNKEPELLLTLIKAILNMIETEETLKYEIGTYSASMEPGAGNVKIEQLSSLFSWLVGQLKLLKVFQQKDTKKVRTRASAASLNMLNPILTEVLCKCLLISSYGKKQLINSAADLAQLTGNSSSAEKFIKFNLHNLSDLNVAEGINSSNLQDESIIEAANKLELVKLRLAKCRTTTTMEVDSGSGGRWTLAKSWNPCPIGMLPSDLGCSGRLSVLDRQDIDKESVNPSEKTGVERSKRGASSDICLIDRSTTKKTKKMLESYESSDTDVLLPADLLGCLMINGVWKKIGKEELIAIESGVRILVQ